MWALTDTTCAGTGADCPAAIPQYEASKSEMYHIIQPKYLKHLHYGSGDVAGYPSTDRFCFADGEDCF